MNPYYWVDAAAGKGGVVSGGRRCRLCQQVAIFWTDTEQKEFDTAYNIGM